MNENYFNYSFSVEKISSATSSTLNVLGKIKEDALDRNVYEYITENFLPKSVTDWKQQTVIPLSYLDRFGGLLDTERKKVDYIGNRMLDFVCGKDITEARTKLNDVATDMSKLSHSLGLFTGCGDMSGFISGFKADDPIIITRWSTLKESYGALKEHTDKLTDAIQDFQTARDYLTSQTDICYAKYEAFKCITFEKAADAYDAMKVLQPQYNIDDKIAAAPLTPIENECDDETAFAQHLAKDPTVDEQQLKDYLFMKAIQMIQFNEDERLWVEQKWRYRLDDINKFMDMCMRLCSQKINSWTRIIALIHSYLKDKRGVIRMATPRVYYIMYMEKHFQPSKNMKRQSINSHFHVTDDDKNEWYPRFDTLFDTTMSPKMYATA